MSNTILLGTRKGVLTFSKEAGNWRRTQEAFVGVHASFAMADPRSGDWWGLLDHGHWGIKLHRSKDRGVTWQETAAPKYAEGLEIRPGKPASTMYLWFLASAPAPHPQRLYLGTIPGGLFTSDDNGESWQMNEALWDHPTRKAGWFGILKEEAGIHSICLDPNDPRHLYLAISAAGVFETRDGGASWAPCNKGCRADFLPDPYAEVGHDPHYVAQCTGTPSVLWQQNHCSVFRSADGGANWSDVSQKREVGPVNFGFTIAADPKDPLTAWVVPATKDEQRVAVDRALCVSRTEDGGQSWQTFRTGLPQHDCYDFAFRHGLDLAGDRLAFGTVGGCLYLSDDRGETWQTLGEHLPPIHSVRFVSE